MDDDGNKMFKKVKCTGTVQELLLEIPQLIKELREREFNRAKSGSIFCIAKRALEMEPWPLSDFAENHRTVNQVVTQMAYYSYRQITVFSVCTFRRETSPGSLHVG